jgi:hypothetical protein
VALVTFGIVASVGLRTLQLHGRWYEQYTLVIEREAQLNAARQLVSALPVGASPPDSDLLVTTDSGVVWRATIGIGVICQGGGSSAILPRARLVSGVDLSAYADTPQPGDTLLVFDDGPSTSMADDRWVRHGIGGVHMATGGCVGGPLADSVTDAGVPAWRFDVSPPLAPTAAGAPARITRLRRLALYPSAPDWMLGFAEVNGASVWSGIQPAAGPLLRHAPAGSGIELHWLDSTLVPALGGAAAFRAVLRAPTRRAVRRPGAPPAALLDSSGFLVTFRNRR